MCSSCVTQQECAKYIYRQALWSLRRTSVFCIFRVIVCHQCRIKASRMKITKLYITDNFETFSVNCVFEDTRLSLNLCSTGYNLSTIKYIKRESLWNSLKYFNRKNHYLNMQLISDLTYCNYGVGNYCDFSLRFNCNYRARNLQLQIKI